MGWETITISREALHEQVWSQPMTKLAKTYGLSDVGLRKICKRLKVPLPPQGYWARKRRGKPSALPSTKGPTEHVVQKWVEPEPELDARQKSEREKLIDIEKQPQNLIRVPEQLDNPHRLVARTLNRLNKAATKKNLTDQSWMSAGPKDLDVLVSPPLIDRAMRIMDALVRALESRKFKVTIQEGRTYVSVLGETFRLNLEESSSRIDHKPTPEEIKLQKEEYWRTPPRYDYLTSGRLSLKLDKDSYGARRTWNDGKKRRVEDCLNAFVIALIEAAYEVKARRAEAERRERERREWERLRAEKEKLIREEKARVKELETEVDQWHRSQQIRAYVKAVQKAAIDTEGTIDPDGDLAKWISWATQQADRLDPLKESPPSILDEKTESSNKSIW